MFDILPLEIVLQIARELQYGDKLELAMICKKISQIVLQHCLYEDVTLYNGKEILAFENGEFNGHQVKSLHIDLINLLDEDYEKLGTVFPNVTNFGHYEDPEDDTRPDSVVDTFKKWKDTLQEYHILFSGQLILKVMAKHTFSRLTTMTISPISFYKYHCRGFSVQMFDCIKNAPSLKDLTLTYCEVNMDFMERLHRSCPNLMCLHFDHTTFFMTGESLPDTIESADNIKHLDFKKTTLISDRRGIFMDYIISKYKQLLSFTSNSDFSGYYNLQTFEKFMRDNINDRLPEDTTYQTLLNDLDDTRTLYKNTFGERLLSRLPRTCKAIEIQAGFFLKILESLHKSEMDLEKLHIIDTHVTEDILEEPLHYLNKWSSLTSLALVVEANDYFSSNNIQLSNVKHLKLKLTLCMVEDYFYFDKVLVAFPCLEHLEITSFEIPITTSTIKREEMAWCPSLSVVELDAFFIHPLLLKYLLWVSPNIKTLGWSVGDRLTQPPESISPDYGVGEKHAVLLKNYMVETRQVAYELDFTGFRLDTLHLNLNFRPEDEKHGYNMHFEVIIANVVHSYYGYFREFKPLEYIRKWDATRMNSFNNTTRVTIICDKLQQIQFGYGGAITF